RERRLYGAAMDIVAVFNKQWLSATRQCLFGTGHPGFKRIVKHDGLRNRTRSSEYIALLCWRDACVKTSDCDSVVPTRSAADDPPPSELQCPALPVRTFYRCNSHHSYLPDRLGTAGIHHWSADCLPD